MFQFHFRFKFYLGLIFVIVSLIIGAITKIIFLLYFQNNFIRWTAIILYILSWPLLVVGGWWIGQEYYRLIKRYVSYKFYHESVKEGTKRAYHHTKARARDTHSRLKARLPQRKKKKNSGKG